MKAQKNLNNANQINEFPRVIITNSTETGVKEVIKQPIIHPGSAGPSSVKPNLQDNRPNNDNTRYVPRYIPPNGK